MASLSTTSDAELLVTSENPVPPLHDAAKPPVTREELRGQKKMMGTMHQYTGILYISHNLGICNNKAEVISVSLRTVKWLHIHWRLY